MLEKINSYYIRQNIFSFTGEIKAMNILKYSKKLQKIFLNIDHINYYKLISGKYIILETKTNGRIYDGYTDEVIYDGEFLNGKKNGKGKE